MTMYRKSKTENHTYMPEKQNKSHIKRDKSNKCYIPHTERKTNDQSKLSFIV